MGNIKDYKIEGEKLYINLWSEAEKKTRKRNADIDVLEVKESEGDENQIPV